MSTTTTTKLRFILAAALASLSLAAATAHADSNNGSGSSHGQGCTGRGGLTMDDGQVNTWHSRYERGSETCTNGEVCTSWGVLQQNGQRIWHYECHDSPIETIAPHRTKLPTATTSTATARVTR